MSNMIYRNARPISSAFKAFTLVCIPNFIRNSAISGTGSLPGIFQYFDILLPWLLSHMFLF